MRSYSIWPGRWAAAAVLACAVAATFDTAVCLAQETNIGMARASGAGTQVVFAAKVVTRTLANRYYIQEPDRSAGIAVNLVRPWTPGLLVNVTGLLRSVSGELVVDLAADEFAGEGPPPVPLGMTNQNAAYEELTEGLLVRVWGKVVATGFGPVFRIDDGSGVTDSGGNPGLRISKGNAIVPVQVGDYVLVRGARGMIGGSYGELPIVYVSFPSDIVKLN